ncbi:VOC family protein [Microbulbifer sp. DLAB2-AF]|uniref:VOC family protein n=1 Tax=Microbulbifer sp. DLAB2-AF TaxID=3243395 RepID=UPI00403A36A2
MKMNYVVLGSNDLEASIRFYNSLFEDTGFEQLFSNERMTFWRYKEFTFSVAEPFDGEEATNGNGTMIGFNAEAKKEVVRLYDKAVELGGTCAGKPAQRGLKFAAYVRDLDGNKICFFE